MAARNARHTSKVYHTARWVASGRSAPGTSTSPMASSYGPSPMGLLWAVAQSSPVSESPLSTSRPRGSCPSRSLLPSSMSNTIANTNPQTRSTLSIFESTYPLSLLPPQNILPFPFSWNRQLPSRTLAGFQVPECSNSNLLDTPPDSMYHKHHHPRPWSLSADG